MYAITLLATAVAIGSIAALAVCVWTPVFWSIVDALSGETPWDKVK